MDTAKYALQIKLPSEDQQIEELLASIVEMVKQREQLALETSFGRTVSRLTEAKTLTFYRLKSSKKEISAVPVLHFINSEIASQQEPGTRAFPLSDNPELAEQLSKSNVADMFQGTAKREKNLILPLRGANAELSGYCQIGNARNDANTRQALSMLLEFYQHFLSLLDDNERDNLTGLLNRKTLTAQITRVLRTLQNRHRRTSDKSAGNYCLAMFDIDHFKRVNDTFGHIYGDEVLLLFANLMRGSFRENDHLFRYGGEEFVALLNNIDIRQAQIVLDRFRAKVDNYCFPQVGRVTASTGVALIRENELPAESINRADLALYFAKEHGRNQVCAYEELVAQGLLAE
ncbi:MAG: GGDEF domain-containing protein [Gallionella sp.]|nr:MAG: GGDEF domain-containing protein [Gallionella sp.]